jgi:CHASE1-domain containing sensor protein
MKLLTALVIVLLSGCSAKELIYDWYDDRETNALEAEIEQATDELRARLRERLNKVRDSSGDRRSELMKAIFDELRDSR